MAWSQKDDGSWTDPILLALSDRAYRLHDLCWTYCADKLTDGRVTRDEVARVAAMFKLVDPRCLDETIKELVTWKVWTEDLHGFVLVGWLDANRSAKEVRKARKRNAERQARWRQKAVPSEEDE
jgi:hypothetical protein